MEIGLKIKLLREQNHMTLEELGNKVGVGKSTVRKWENGIIANMRRDKIAKLANALGCTPAYLMGWDETAISEISEAQKQANAYEDAVEVELMPLFDLGLTPEEAKEVVKYAKYVISQRG